MTTLNPETEKDRQIDELHSWYINNQIIIHPERDNIFRKELKQFIAKAEQRAIKTTLERVDESIETAKESILLETACEPDGYDLWVKNTEELEKILDQALSTLKQELLESE